MEVACQYTESSRLSILAIVLSLLCFSTASHASEITQQQIQKLDQQFIEASAAFYKHQTGIKPNKLKVYTRVEILLSDIDKLMQSKQYIKAVSLIKYNQKLINIKIDHPAIITFMSILLDLNELTTANQIYIQIQSAADQGTIAKASYLFARYHYKRKDFVTTMELLSEFAEDLPGDEANQAILLSGICLQKLKQHRKSIKVYSNITNRSRYYPAARLNTAIANIRQGWWTDGHKMLRDVLHDPRYKKSEVILNRLYLVLGYSLLYKEFYRDARDAFRNVGLNSPHTNRALLGIALAATSQEDHIGALNALTILKNKGTFDLSVDEAYLLLPYIYEKLGQGLTSSSSYTDAMNHYAKRIKQIQTGKKRIESKNIDILTLYQDNKISFEHFSFDASSDFPGYIFNNYRQLNHFKINLNNSKNLKLKKHILPIFTKYQTTMNQIALTLIDKKITNLRSYMNQSRFGLARLYDKSADKK